MMSHLTVAPCVLACAGRGGPMPQVSIHVRRPA